MEDQSPDKNIVFSAASASPISTEHTLEPATDPTVLIYSNAINMVVERLGNTLATTIGTAMANVADSMQHMTAAFEKQNRQQVYSSYEDTCAVGALASRSCSQDDTQGKTPSLFERTREREAPRLTSEGGAQYDFKNHGSKKPTNVASLAPRHSTHSLTKWDTKNDLALDSDESPSKHSVISFEAGDIDEFDVAVQQLTTMPVLPPNSPPNPPIVTTIDIDLLMRTTNRTIFKLNCGDVSHARSTDIKLQHAEQNVVKATYPIIRAVADLQQLEQPTLKPALEKLMDGVILLTDTIQELEQSRRELYKNVLPDGWKGLLAKPDEKHDELFGNIETHLKDCQADTKLQEQVVEEQAKEVKKLTDKPFVPKRKYCDFSGYQTASKWKPQRQQAKFSKNEKRFPKQNQGPVGKRSDRRRDYRGGRGYRH